MRILLTTPAYAPSSFGGVKNYVTTLSRELAKVGNEVTVYTSNAYDYRKNLPLRGEYLVGNVRVIYLKNCFPKKYWHTPGVILQMIKDRKKFDVIHLNNNFNYKNMLVFWLAFFCRIPVVFSAHGSLTIRFQNRLLKWVYNTFITRPLLSYASKLIALNPQERNQYIALGAKPEKVEIIPLGITLDDYPDDTNRMHFREKHNIAENETVILFMGRLHYIKGLEYAVRAVGKNIKDGRPIRFIIAGPDFGEQGKLQALAAELKIENHITFTGLVEGNEKVQLFRNSDIFILSSVSDMFPTVVLEAAYCGLPLILTEGVLLSDTIKKEAAIVVPLDDDRIASAIKEFINDSEKRVELANKGHTLIKNHYSSAAIGRQILALYQSATAPQSRSNK